VPNPATQRCEPDVLEKVGLVFNTAETQSFRDGLKSGGFYKDWRTKLGDEPWEILERYAGKLG
jgi:hypothetical protein